MLPKSKPITIGCCYLHPKSVGYLDEMEEVINKIDPGDLNICLNAKRGNLFYKYNNLMKIFGLSQLIEEPTRISSSTQ